MESSWIDLALITFVASGNILIASNLRQWKKNIDKELQSYKAPNQQTLADTNKDEIETVDLNMYHVLTIPISSSITLIILLYFFSWVQYLLIAMFVVSLISTIQYLISELGYIAYHGIYIRSYLSDKGHMNHITTEIYPKLFMSTVSTLCSIICLLDWIITGSLWTHNFIASTLAIAFISLVKIPNLKIATYLLVLLLIYDIYWVFLSEYYFNTNVMVTVAKKVADNPVQSIAKYYHIPFLQSIKSTLDLPLKLIFPSYTNIPGAVHYSVLGLGDITLPGMVISLAFDLDQQSSDEKAQDDEKSSNTHFTDVENRRPRSTEIKSNKNTSEGQLFSFGMIGYMIGLIVAVLASRISNHPQPALLYIVPSVLLFITFRAIWEGRLLEIWNGRKMKDESS